MRRARDGSAGDADYGAIGGRYTHYRQPEPHIAAFIIEALGTASTVLNVGAGAGSYEPGDRAVTAIEPSAVMRAQRPAHISPALDATAEHLPFADQSFDAAMTTFSVHQWGDLQAGLREMRRVARGPILVLTCDPERVRDFWLNDYAPEVLAAEARRYPALPEIARYLGGRIAVEPVPIPLQCRDGFNEAYYGRPEMLLDEGARLSCSAWSFIGSQISEAYVDTLRHSLEEGTWDARHGQLRTQPSYNGSLRLIVGMP
jgi:SAM-dependent methyltransferase